MLSLDTLPPEETAQLLSRLAGRSGLDPDLAAGQRRLFRRLRVGPGPDIDAHAAAALDDTSPDQAHRHLEGLHDQHLLTQPAQGRYRPHDMPARDSSRAARRRP